MAIIILIGMVYAIRALVRAGSAARAQRRAAQLYYERQRQQALQAARAAALREEYRQRQLEARQETARLISAERARQEQERQERREQEQRAKEAQRAEKEAQKARKAAIAREQAEEDMEHYAGMRDAYTELIDALREELADSSITQKRRNTVQRQILDLEEKVYKIDQRRAKAYYIVKGAC